MAVENFNFLSEKLPGFKVSGNKIRTLNEPDEFYNELLSLGQKSKKRILLSALYLGTGSLEKKLVETVKDRLKNQKTLQVKVLLDWCRGTRLSNGESSATLLADLVNEDTEKCRVAMYHTPYLRGWLKRLLPSKLNELVGLQHGKVFVFDNTIIISGANLSNDYFTNRQDRYIVIEDCPGLADYYERLFDTISSFSLVMDGKCNFETDKDLKSHPYEGDIVEFIEESSRLVNMFLEEEKLRNQVDLTDFDTVVFPSVQMGQLGVAQDSEITQKILCCGRPEGSFNFATGYFNITDEYSKDILEESQSNFNILLAHPQANGFLGAGGLAGGIPAAYTYLAKQFFSRIQEKDQSVRVKMFEFQREGWTYHAKGLWYSTSASKDPCLTMVGSPNYGYRSVMKDLETQVTILTTNKQLQKMLTEERDRVFMYGRRVEMQTFQQEERKVPFWVKVLTRFAKHLL